MVAVNIHSTTVWISVMYGVGSGERHYGANANIVSVNEKGIENVTHSELQSLE